MNEIIISYFNVVLKSYFQKGLLYVCRLDFYNLFFTEIYASGMAQRSGLG